MNNVVEKQTVQMEFDNKNFEKNVNTSLSTLDKLKVGLSTLAIGATGFAGVAAQIKGITFDPINNGVQMGIGKVMALTAALTGVVNLSDALYQKVTSTVKALSVDQIQAGFSKYEDKTASVQTIMSAVRKEGEADEEVMARVEEQLAKLNWFTDETSYNFIDMVSNIGKFTSQGIDLEKSVTAMQGIATWAAKSGQGTAEASRAMYNLSQAMGVGAVKLMDWKSIENANMATKEFKEQAMEAAVAAGTLRKEGDKYIDTLKGEEVSVQNFSQSLASGWFSSDVLMDVLNNYGKYATMVHDIQLEKEFDTAAEAMEYMKEQGMEMGNELSSSAFKAAQEAKTFTEAIEATKDAVSTAFLNIFENLFGNYLEAKELWTDFANLLYDAFASPVVALADLSKEWKELGGREKLLASITRIIESLTSAFDKFSEVSSSVFGSIEGKLPLVNRITDNIDKISIRFSNFVKKIVENEKIWDNFGKLLYGFKRTLDFLKVTFMNLFNKAFIPLFINKLPPAIEKVSELAAVFGDFLADLANKAIAFDPVSKAIEFLTDKFSFLVDAINEFLGISENVKNNGMVKTVTDLSKALSNVEFDKKVNPLNKFKEAFGKFGDFLNSFGQKVSPLFYSIFNACRSFFSWIITLVKGIGPALKLAGEFIKKALDKISGFFDAFVDASKSENKNPLEMLAEIIAGGIKYLMDKLKGVDLERLNAWLDAIEKIIRMVAEIIVIYQMVTDGSVSVGANIELPFANVFDSLSESLEKSGKAKKTEATAKLIEALAAALVAIAGALYIVSKIDADRLAESAAVLAALSIVFTTIIGAIEVLFGKLMTGVSGKGSILSMVGIDAISQRLAIMSLFILAIGAAILMLTGALSIIGNMDWKDAMEGLIDVVSLMASLIGVAYAMKGIDHAAKLIAVGLAMIIISEAVGLISLAVAKLAKTENAIDGLIAMTDMLITMIGVVYALSGLKNVKTIIAASLAIIILSKATQNIAKAVVKLSKIKDKDSMTAAGVMLSAIMGYMVLLTALASAMSNSSSILAVSAAMIIISMAIMNVAKVVEDICKIKDPELVTKTLMQLGGMATALVSLVGIMIALSQTLMTAGKIDISKVAALSVLTVALMGMVIPLTAIATALTGLSLVAKDSGNLLQAASAIGIVFAAIAAILVTASQFTLGQVGAMMAMAMSVDILCASLLILAPALTALSNVNVGAVATVATVIGAVAYLLLKAMQVMGGEASLIKFAGILDLLALSITLVGAGLYLAAKALEVFVDQLIRFASVKADVWQNMTQNVIQGVTNAFTAFVPLVVKAMDDTIMGVLASVLNNASKIIEAVTVILRAIVGAVVTILKEYIPGIVEALDILVMTLGPFILDRLLPFIYELTKDVTAFAIKIFNQYMPQINEALENITWDLFLRILNLLNKGVPMLNKELALEGLNLIMWLNWLLEQATAVIIRGIINILTQIRDNIDEIIALTVEIGVTTLFGLLDGLIKSVPLLYEKLTILIDDLLDLINEVLDTDWDKVTETLEKLANKTIDVANKWVEKETDVGGKIFNIVGNLFKGLVKAAWKHASTSMYSPIGLGNWIGDKVAEGLCKNLKINSPSKVMEQIGGYIISGLGIGINKGKEVLSPIISELGSIVKTDFTNNFGSISDITANLGNSLLSGFNSTLGGFDFGSILGDFTNLNPTITPQLDLSQIEKGAMGLDSIFASQQMSGIMGGKFLTPNTGADSVTNSDQMNKFLEKMGDYMDVQSYNKDTNINVVLDGDAKKMLKVLKVEDNKQAKATRVPKMG